MIIYRRRYNEKDSPTSSSSETTEEKMPQGATTGMVVPVYCFRNSILKFRLAIGLDVLPLDQHSSRTRHESTIS